MPTSLNQAPEFFLNYFFHTNNCLHAINTALTTPKLSAWPRNILVKQDMPLEHYAYTFAKILMKNICNTDLPAVINWQLQQTYRVINAAIASTHPSLNQHRDELIKLRMRYETLIEIKTWLQNIDQDKIQPDVVCVGHGSAKVSHGYIESYKYEKYNVKVVVYAKNGSKLGNKLATDIDNDRYNPNRVEIRNLKTGFAYASRHFPTIYTAESVACLPDYGLSSHNGLQARIIEFKTGRVLYQASNTIYLSEIIRMFSNRRIHWSACAEIYATADTKIGPFADIAFGKTYEPPTVKATPGSYYRLFSANHVLNSTQIITPSHKQNMP